MTQLYFKVWKSFIMVEKLHFFIKPLIIIMASSAASTHKCCCICSINKSNLARCLAFTKKYEECALTKSHSPVLGSADLRGTLLLHLSGQIGTGGWIMLKVLGFKLVIKWFLVVITVMPIAITTLSAIKYVTSSYQHWIVRLIRTLF